MRLWLTIQIAVLTAFGSADIEPARLLLNEANLSYRQMRTERAVELYREYLNRYSDRADVRVWLGAALLNMGSWEDAITQAEHAIELDPRNAKAYTLKGRVLAAQEKWKFASAAFATAVKLNPRDPDAWYFAGRASFAEERFENAIEQFSHVVKLGQAQSRVYMNLGEALDALGRTSEAETALRQAVTLAGMDVPANGYKPWLEYGVFLYKQLRPVESIPMLRKAFLIAPDQPETRFELGRVLYQNGQLTEAVDILQGATQSHDCRVFNLLSRVHRTLGKEADADRDLQAWQVCNEAAVALPASGLR